MRLKVEKRNKNTNKNRKIHDIPGNRLTSTSYTIESKCTTGFVNAFALPIHPL